MSEQCANCIYWLHKTPNPLCRRDPHYEIHGESDWCGEYKGMEGRFPVTSEPGADQKQPVNNPAISESENAVKAAAPPEDPIRIQLESARNLNAALKAARKGRKQ